jgi:hypothetical protein
MFGFVSVIEYNHLKKLRNEIFLEKEEIAHRCKLELQKKDTEIQQRDEEIQKYKKLYLDELQKRLELAETIRKMEGENENCKL